MSATGPSPARACAYAVLRRVFEQGAYADRALHAEAVGLNARDRALATALAYGTVQRRATLDHVAAALCRRPLAELDPPVLSALRLGLLQLLMLGGIADHAAVSESVELVKTVRGGGGAGLVNAVLRRAIRDGREILDRLSDATAAQAAILHSVPQWLAELWWRELGPEPARALLRSINEPAESALRVNTLVGGVADAEAELARLGVRTTRVPDQAEALILQSPFDVHGSALWARGAVMPQSRGSMRVGQALDPGPGERVLDLCAAPGAKTTQLAALMADDGTVTAVERHPGRAQALGRTLERMHAASASVVVADAGRAPPDHRGYDRVLVDPPCSGLGTLQSRPDLRWRTSPARIAELAGLQARILRAGAAATRPGGTLVYSVCTISRAEGPDLVDSFLAEQDGEFAAEGLGRTQYLQLRPDQDATDGFFIARLRRAPASRAPRRGVTGPARAPS